MSQETISHLTKLAMLSALKKTFAGQWFNLSGVDEACHIVGRPVYVDNNDWHTMRALHCVNWSQFDAQSKHELVETVARVLGVEVQVLDNAKLLPSMSLVEV